MLFAPTSTDNLGYGLNQYSYIKMLEKYCHQLFGIFLTQNSKGSILLHDFEATCEQKNFLSFFSFSILGF